MPANTRTARKPGAASTPFVISRVLDARRERVWDALTDPERMQQWWGPKGFTVTRSKMDLRPGGAYHYCLRAPDGALMWGKFVYREIVRPEHIVVVSSFSDEAGGVTRHPMVPTWPLEMLSTFLLTEEVGGRTRFTVKWEPLNPTDEERKTFEAGFDSMQQGWTGTFDQLEAYLPRA